MRKQKRSRSSRKLRSISTTKRRRTRQRGGDKKCLFINWGPKIGLGNQLCIYAAAVVIKNKLKEWDICIPPVKDNPHTKTDYRSLFKQGRPVEESPEIKERIQAAALIHKHKDIRHGLWKNTDLIVNSGDEFKNSTKNLRMKTTEEPEGGYYQNYGSIKPAIETVRAELQKELASRYGSDTTVEKPDSAAFIHIRYGDYKSNSMNASMDYYKAAKARLEKEAAIEIIYIISQKDGTQWAKEEGLLTEAGKTIRVIDEEDELKVLYIMSQCKAGACISPSTYSMWGAILGPGERESSTIIYPSKWIKISGKDLNFPERWIVI